MKQKLALACTLVHTPKVIFLDEPTTGVDPVSRRDFWRILQRLLADGITIVMSTPYLDEAERCSRVALMDRGRAIRVAAPAALKEEMRGVVLEIVCERVREAFLVLRDRPERVREVQAFGDRVNAMVDRPEDAEAVRSILAGKGITVSSLRAISPSLENVFISLLTHTEGAST
jgi:ABC-2 type transport system ATP-binding protein